MVRPMAYGRPGTRVIPRRWAADHRPIMEGTMTGLCEIRERDQPGVGTDPVVMVPGALVLPQAVPCRVQRINREQIVSVGQQQVTLADYLVTVPYTPIDIGPDHVIRLIAQDDEHADGETLVGSPLVITAVAQGTLLWERDLYASLDQG